MRIKDGIRAALRAAGLEVRRVSREPGRDAFEDMKRICRPSGRPVVFDVGANEGQTVANFRTAFPDATVHAFEPGMVAFEVLRTRHAATPGVELNNLALGARKESREFIENTHSVMSSFLETGPDGWGEERSRRALDVQTIDDYCTQKGIGHIDVLKSDTQGYDLEVLRGGLGMIRLGAVSFVLLEVTFAKLYEGLPRFDEIYGFLADNGYRLVAMYRTTFQGSVAGWTDALFVRADYAATHGLDRD